MSPHSKTLILAALAFCALAFAQGPLPPAGGGAGAGAPGGAAVSGIVLNQSAVLGATAIAVCPAGAQNYCTYLAGVQIECNPANPGTGTGGVNGFLTFSDAVQTNVSIQTTQLNVATCATYNVGATTSIFAPRFLAVKPGSTIYYQVTLGTMTGTYNYDLAWFAQRLS